MDRYLTFAYMCAIMLLFYAFASYVTEYLPDDVKHFIRHRRKTLHWRKMARLRKRGENR